MGEQDDANDSAGKPLHVRLLILIVLALAAIGWMTLIDAVWPK